jgi:hypothetical protein
MSNCHNFTSLTTHSWRDQIVRRNNCLAGSSRVFLANHYAQRPTLRPRNPAAVTLPVRLPQLPLENLAARVARYRFNEIH